MTPNPDDLLTLDQAAAFVPGADAGTLKRRIRQGKLVATRPGKAYLTTLIDVRNMVKACRVVPKVHASGSVHRDETTPETSPTNPHGLSATALANISLDSVLGPAKKKKTKL